MIFSSNRSTASSLVYWPTEFIFKKRRFIVFSPALLFAKMAAGSGLVIESASTVISVFGHFRSRPCWFIASLIKWFTVQLRKRIYFITRPSRASALSVHAAAIRTIFKKRTPRSTFATSARIMMHTGWRGLRPVSTAILLRLAIQIPG
jgi:hypothetical protein